MLDIQRHCCALHHKIFEMKKTSTSVVTPNDTPDKNMLRPGVSFIYLIYWIAIAHCEKKALEKKRFAVERFIELKKKQQMKLRKNKTKRIRMRKVCTRSPLGRGKQWLWGRLRTIMQRKRIVLRDQKQEFRMKRRSTRWPEDYRLSILLALTRWTTVHIGAIMG